MKPRPAASSDLAEIKIEIPPSEVGPVEDILLEQGDGAWSVLEDAIARRAWIVGIFPAEAGARAAWAGLAPLLPGGLAPNPEVRRLAGRDWADSYKAHFKAWQFGRLHWVPVWERGTFALPPGHAVLWLDPGLAFGTGNHETTRLCCERLAALAEAGPAGRRVVDAGCGSGILALSAALLGFGRIEGFDLDPEAVRVSRENAELNGLEGRVRFFEADLAAGLRDGPADLVLANIQADILIRNADALAATVAPGGSLVLSGILASEIGSVRAAFAAAAPGWSSDSRTLGEWCDLSLTRS